MSWPKYASPMQGFNLLSFMKPRAQRQAPVTPHSGAGNMQPMQDAEPKPQQGWWGGFKDRMNIDDQTLLMSGLGLLAGDRYSGPQMALQNLAYGMDANKAEKKDAERKGALTKALGMTDPAQRNQALMQAFPEYAAQASLEQAFAPPKGPEYFKSGEDIIGVSGGQANVIYDAPDAPKGPESPIGKIMADYKAGLIDEETASAAIARANAPRQPLVQNTINPEAPPFPTNKTLTPLQEKMDDEYASLLVQWNIGGAGDAVKQLDQLGEVANRLESGDNITGWILGSMPDWVLAGLNPQAMDTKELVQEVVQRSLRETLGAQFTEREGEMLLARAYNPRLDEKLNAQRLRRLVGAVEARAQQLNSLNEYMQRNGTSAGWDGSLMSANQILAEMDSVSGGANTPKANQKRLVFNPATGEFE